jgi:hypothetical protein
VARVADVRDVEQVAAVADGRSCHRPDPVWGEVVTAVVVAEVDVELDELQNRSADATGRKGL